MLTELTDEQAAYIGVKKEGPYQAGDIPLLIVAVTPEALCAFALSLRASR